MRDERASPSGSRTVGQATIVMRQPQLFDHPPHQEELLRVLLAEVRGRRTHHVEQPMDGGEHAGEVPGPGGAFQDVADRAGIGRDELDTRWVELVHGGRPDEVDAEAIRPGRRRALRRAGSGTGPRPGPNCFGFTKIDTTTTSRSERARRINDAWPSCSAPIVGTSPTSAPADRRSSTAAVRSAAARISSIARAPRRPRRGDRPAGDRRSTPARAPRDRARRTPRPRPAPTRGAPRGCARSSPASPRTAGPVSAAPRAQTFHVVQARALQREHRGERVGHAGAPEQVLGDRAGHDEVVRREHGGGVIQRTLRVVQPERPRHQVVGDPLADRVPLGVVGRHRHRASRDEVERGGDVGERLQRMDARAAGHRPLARARGRRAPRPPTGGPPTARNGTRSASAICSTIAGIVVVGDPDQHQLAGARRVRGIQERHVGQEPRRTIAGGTATRRRRRSDARRDRAAPPSRSPRVPRRRPRCSSQRVCQLRGSTRSVRRARERHGRRLDADQVAVGPREHPLRGLDDDDVVQRDRSVRDPGRGADVPRGIQAVARRRCPAGRSPDANPWLPTTRARGAVRRPREHPCDRERLGPTPYGTGLGPRPTPWKYSPAPCRSACSCSGRAGSGRSDANDACGTTIRSDSAETATIA